MLKVAIIGYGYWGPNLVRNFNSLDNCQVVKVADIREERLNLVKKKYASISTANSSQDIFSDPGIDAVVIATPVSLHYEQAKLALENNKHVLVEKPLAVNSREAQELIDLSLKNDKVLMVDHTFLYTGAVRSIKQLLEDKAIGDLLYFDSTRINLGLFQPDISVLWDLACHDIAILNYLTDERPVSVIATGISHTNNTIENIAYLTLSYRSNFIAHFNCSWTSPVKIRKILIGGSEKMIVFDDVEPTEKVKVYDTTFNIQPGSDESKRDLLIDYRVGDIYIPKLDKEEALWGLAKDFYNSIINKSQPRSNMHGGLEVVKILEAAEESIKNGGTPVKINY